MVPLHCGQHRAPADNTKIYWLAGDVWNVSSCQKLDQHISCTGILGQWVCCGAHASWFCASLIGHLRLQRIIVSQLRICRLVPRWEVKRQHRAVERLGCPRVSWRQSSMAFSRRTHSGTDITRECIFIGAYAAGGLSITRPRRLRLHRPLHMVLLPMWNCTTYRL